MDAFRSIRQILTPPGSHWVGDGFHVFPLFNNKAFSKDLSPFLMFDYGQAKHFPKTTKRRGVGRHPHRGFETVTIALQGSIEHADSVGNTGVIGPGDVQWMTAGRGIIHEEFHSTEFAKTGGVLEMVQLWVNLPSKHKMSPPKYQGILKDAVPSVPYTSPSSSSSDPSAIVRVIAGSYAGQTGPAETFTPIDMWDVEFLSAPTELPTELATSSSTTPQDQTEGDAGDKNPGPAGDGGSGVPDRVAIELPVVRGYTVIVHVREGEVRVGPEVKEGDKQSAVLQGPQGIALLSRKGDSLLLQGAPGSKVLLLMGQPIDEPIVHQGPFCMNTRAELQAAMEDYQSGDFGQ